MFLVFTAVKFGRMSKKQREKVEEEVQYHKEMGNQHNTAASGVTNLNAGTANGNGSIPGLGRSHTNSGSSPDTTGSVFDPQQPSSTDHLWVLVKNYKVLNFKLANLKYMY